MKKPAKRELNPKPLFDEKLLFAAFEEHGIHQSHARTIWRMVTQQGLIDISSIPSLPKAALKLIEEEFVLLTSKVISRTDAKDKSTTKLLIELQDGQRIETVIMRYGDVALANFPAAEKVKMTEEGNYDFKSNKRATVCVSSQVGCAMGCTFCATGTMNLLANLTAGEILEQLYHANQVEKIRNCVFMGMGEPLDNYDAVLQAITGMIDVSRFSMSPSRVTISTVGVVPRLLTLARDMPQIGLALSLHAPNQELRTQIVPTSKAWHISKIMDAAIAFIANQNKNVKSANRKRHVLVEYVLIKDINDSLEVAKELGALLAGQDMLLNVIPYNKTAVPYDYNPPSAEACALFVATTRSCGVHTLFRQELGQDISSACGQLVIENPAKCDTADIEDIFSSSTKVSKPAMARRLKEDSKLSITPGKLSQNLPGIIIQYAILLLVLIASYRLFTRIFGIALI